MDGSSFRTNVWLPREVVVCVWGGGWRARSGSCSCKTAVHFSMTGVVSAEEGPDSQTLDFKVRKMTRFTGLLGDRT